METVCCKERPHYGRPACDLFDVGNPIGTIVQPRKDSTNQPNRTALSAVTYNWFQGLLYDSDVQKRLYPLPLFKNFSEAVEDTQFETASNSEKSKLRNGLRSYKFELWDADATPQLAGKLNDITCKANNIYITTDLGYLIGAIYENTSGQKLFGGIPIGANSLDAKYMLRTDANVQKNMVGFDFDRIFNVKQLYAINMNELFDTEDEVVKSFDLSDLPQIIDCSLDISSISTTGFTAVVNDDFRQGSRVDPFDDEGNVEGKLAADFLLENLTDATTVAIVSLNEVSPGKYAITHAAQTSSDKMKVSLVLDDTETLNHSGSAKFLIP